MKPRVKSLDGLRGVRKVGSRIPLHVLVVVAGPLDSILKLVSIAARIENLFDFPLFLIVNDNWRGLSYGCPLRDCPSALLSLLADAFLALKASRLSQSVGQGETLLIIEEALVS
jgi:hypothetical protein